MILNRNDRSRSALTQFNALCVAMLLCGLAACSKQADPQPDNSAPKAALSNINIDEVERDFWQDIDKKLQNSTGAAEQLAQAIQLFLREPSADTLAHAQTTLSETLLVFSHHQNIAMLQKAAPEIFVASGSRLLQIQIQPIQPGYLDRFGPYRYSGLVYDVGFELTQESLIQQHGLTDEEEVVLGIYAMEFMLFGENGNRSAQDYVEVTTLTEAHKELNLTNLREVPNNRRRTLIELQSQQLVSDLAQLRQAININEEKDDMKRWMSLSDSEKISKIRKSLRSGSTHSLLALSSIQNALAADDDLSAQNKKSSGAYPKLTHQARMLANQVRALKSMAPYLSDIEQRAVEESLEQAADKLSRLNFDASEEPLASMQEIYEFIKQGAAD